MPRAAEVYAPAIDARPAVQAQAVVERVVDNA